MKRLYVAVLTIFLLTGLHARAERETPVPELFLTLDLTDGSRIIGKPDRTEFDLITPYATIRIPLAETRQITRNPGDKSDTLIMCNGDNLSGIVSRFPSLFATLFGDIVLEPGTLRRIRVSRRYGELPREIVRSRVLYLPFHSPQALGDDDAHALEITPHGGRWIPDGPIGGAYEFTEDGYIELGPTRNYSTQGELSGCAWVRRRDRYFTVISNYRGGIDYGGQFIFGIDGLGRFELVLGQADGVSVRYISAQADPVPRNEWRHIAFTYSEARDPGQKVRFYVDGDPIPAAIVVQDGNRGVILNSPQRLRLMAHVDKGTFCRSHGGMDEIMLFHRALSDEEIFIIAHQSRDSQSGAPVMPVNQPAD